MTTTDSGLPAAGARPDAQTLREWEDAYGSSNYKPLPVVLSHGKGARLFDIEGRAYIDMLSAYSAVSHGHGHPRILRALAAQAERLCMTSRAFRNDQLGPFLKELCELTGMARALPMNTGAEAVETAIKIARKWAYAIKNVPNDTAEIVAFTDNFHGRTTTIVGMSTSAKSRDHFGPFTPGFRVLPYGDIDAVRAAVGERTAMVLVEPIQGEAGVRIPPDGFLRELRAICDKTRTLLVFDEIQTGLGRCGRMFCHEYEDVRPDAMCLGKALGGGVLPISAVVSTEEVLGLFKPGEHGSTFGGNPLACACAREAMRVLVEEDLPGRAARLGERLIAGLRKVATPRVVDVRGRGLLTAIELAPGEPGARTICERLMNEGVLAKETRDTTIRFAPPLVITEEELDDAIGRIGKVLAEA
ncbi:ornithine--oxo-acid transaminase [bacterium]|nr:ornithine--oxo-acid transaminase [bacterium]